jgi:uncharacterized protein YegJ (DUF2314 family)
VAAFGASDADHESAKAAARATLPSFWRAFEAHGAVGDFILKVGLPAAHESLEHVWVGRIVREPDSLRGVLENQPVHTTRRLRLGDEIEFQEDQISYWAYRTGDLWFGHFTTRLMLDRPADARIPADMAAEVRSTLSDSPIED